MRPPERFGRTGAQRGRPPDDPAATTAPVPAATPDEPELLTHRARIPPPPPPVDRGGSGDGGAPVPSGPRRGRFRRFALIACLLAVLAPIAAFFIGWLIYDVPSPAALASQRKQITTLYYSDGETEIGRYVPEEGNRIEVPIEQVPMHVRNAVLAAEDRSFRSNPGFDVVGIGRAVWDQLTGGSSGGSTITQQYVKVATGKDAYSYLRKYREVILAAKLTKESSKEQILENYLNAIYFGRGAYGIQAASQAYFGKDVADLTVAEGALLAGVIQSPSAWDPAENLGHAKFRWNFVLDGMVAEGWLSRSQRGAQQFPVTVPPEQGIPGSPGDDRAHIIDRALAELEANGLSRDELAAQGGKVITTIDARAQQAARDAVSAELDGQPKNLHSALVAIDPDSGGVRAYFGGAEGVGYDLAGGPAWSPGSSFKPFTMLAALQQEIGINSVYDGDSPLTINGIEFANYDSSSYNALTLREAMTQSVNTTFVQLAADVGPRAVREAAIDAGIPKKIGGAKSLVEAGNGQPGLGITLGQYPVHVIDMASAFSTFANDGMRNEPFIVKEYVNAEGTTVYQHEADPGQALDPDDEQHNTQLARNVTATLTRVAASSGFPLDGGREVAAKTGTHQLGDTGNNSAAWTVGYTPSISTAVWVGDPAHTPLVNASGGDVFGKGLPGSIWQRFMNDYLEGTEPQPFPPFELLGSAGGPARNQLVAETTEAPEPAPETTEEQPAPTTTAPSPEPTPTPTEPPPEPDSTEAEQPFCPPLTSGCSSDDNEPNAEPAQPSESRPPEDSDSP
ncbi:MAG: penicillin-binding protein [Pseudonocardiaceae bacterium]|nr:penicillin-binding protein [Pseudonocardiaceae bacterium]